MKLGIDIEDNNLLYCYYIKIQEKEDYQIALCFTSYYLLFDLFNKILIEMVNQKNKI
jgi:hypothetical protein